MLKATFFLISRNIGGAIAPPAPPLPPALIFNIIDSIQKSQKQGVLNEFFSVHLDQIKADLNAISIMDRRMLKFFTLEKIFDKR